MPKRHTIHLAETCEATGYASAITPVVYGTAQLTGVAPGTAMAIRYHRERATATMDGWSYVHTAATPSVRILHSDVLVIGDHQFQVFCPGRMRVPELRLVAA